MSPLTTADLRPQPEPDEDEEKNRLIREYMDARSDEEDAASRVSLLDEQLRELGVDVGTL